MEEVARAALCAPAPLTAEHELSQFDCGAPALNDWLRHRALKNESRFSRTYVVSAGKRVAGYAASRRLDRDARSSNWAISSIRFALIEGAVYIDKALGMSMALAVPKLLAALPLNLQ